MFQIMRQGLACIGFNRGGTRFQEDRNFEIQTNPRLLSLSNLYQNIRQASDRLADDMLRNVTVLMQCYYYNQEKQSTLLTYLVLSNIFRLFNSSFYVNLTFLQIVFTMRHMMDDHELHRALQGDPDAQCEVLLRIGDKMVFDALICSAFFISGQMIKKLPDTWKSCIHNFCAPNTVSFLLDKSKKTLFAWNVSKTKPPGETKFFQSLYKRIKIIRSLVTLGLNPYSENTKSDVGKAYRLAALRHHPDHKAGDVGAMVRVNSAYELLKILTEQCPLTLKRLLLSPHCPEDGSFVKDSSIPSVLGSVSDGSSGITQAIYEHATSADNTGALINDLIPNIALLLMTASKLNLQNALHVKPAALFKFALPSTLMFLVKTPVSVADSKLQGCLAIIDQQCNYLIIFKIKVV